ncbi:DUF4145 domain-containing protein [Marinobacterium arenosum]|uniref:DUF4145 domain-containing protein n=1 Tax=Marinobacterium arenosum TaxID=2862496 RepID=UPI001C9724C7|nr:DUF4145 domain-containing protein [Marinobacterium arenosum]MBY4678889.1 hypothetical protein [Marinobacterium arenosum]
MKTTVFRLEGGDRQMPDPALLAEIMVYEIPTLPAYSILAASLEFSDPFFSEATSGNPDFAIDGNRLQVNPRQNYFGAQNRLIVHYAGIRDYSLLFPHIDTPALQQRLGQFAEEAEKAFDAGAWMSFVMMAGAVIEGLLSVQYHKRKFHQLIDSAQDSGLLSERDAQRVHDVREARNTIHADRYQDPFVDRCLAMDIFQIYDQLIKRHWSAGA